MPGLGVGDHQVARHPVAVHRDLRLREGARHQAVAGVGPGRGLLAAPGDAAFARHAPVGKERQLAAQQRVVVGRQRRARDACPARRRGRRWRRASARRPGRCRRWPARSAAPRGRARCRDRREGESRGPGRPRERAARAGRPAAIRPATWMNGPHVFLRRRRVHDDDAAAAFEVGAQVAAKAGVARRRPQARDDQAARRARPRRARRRRRAAGRVGPGNGGRQGRRIHGRRRSAFEVRTREPRG